MTEQKDDWGDLESLPPPKKGPPKWMLACGCGCLVPGFLLVAVVAWGLQFIAGATRPDRVYETLEEMVAFDETLRGTPTGTADDPDTRAYESHIDPEFRPLFGAEIPFSKGTAIVVLGRDVPGFTEDAEPGPDGLYAFLIRIPSEQGDDFLVDARDESRGEPFTLTVQGVELEGVRVEDGSGEVPEGFLSGTDTKEGAAAIVRLRDGFVRPQDAEEADPRRWDLVLTLLRPDSTEPITDEELTAFLEPFHLGEDR